MLGKQFSLIMRIYMVDFCFKHKEFTFLNIFTRIK